MFKKDDLTKLQSMGFSIEVPNRKQHKWAKPKGKDNERKFRKQFSRNKKIETVDERRVH